jgi:hypothetical protein
MKARKMVAAATVAGFAVLGSTGAAGALTAPDASVPSTDGITIKVGGLVGDVLGTVGLANPVPPVAVPDTSSLPIPAPAALPQPDVKYSTAGVSVNVGTIHVAVGVPAVQVPMPKLPAAAPTVAVPDPTGHVALVQLYLASGVQTAKAMAEAFAADGTKTFQSYSESTTRAITAGLELAGLGPIQITLAQHASWAWTQFETNRDFVTRTINLTI